MSKLHASKVLCGLILLIFAILPAARSDTGLGRHKKIYAVPAPGKVTIDGKLDDWDNSGQIFMYVVSETSDMQSARFGIMYDADALYLGAVVRDPSPMMNRHDPKVDGNKGWDADACQFRMTLDPKMGYPIQIGHGQGDMTNRSIVHLILWYYTDKKLPCLQMHASMKYVSPRDEWKPFGVVPQDIFQAKYLKMDDGRGYTFEYRIPWSTLGAKTPPKGGDLVAGTVQFNWSRPDGLKTAGGSAWCYDVMAGPGFPYQQTGCWGKIIFSGKGNLPRELVEEGLPPEKPLPLKFAYEVPEDSQITVQLFDKESLCRRILVPQGDRRAGQNVELWDGLDDQGKPLLAGEYVWKGIYHKPIRQKFLFSPHNSGHPPYATDDNKGGWGGDHGTPTTPCVFKGGVLLAWNSCEAGWGIIKCNLNGRRQWGSKHCATHLATDGKRFFTAGDHGFDRAPGVKAFDLADSRPLNFGGGKPQLLAPPGSADAASNEVTGLACADGVIYVSYRARNLIGVFNANSGELKGTWSVPGPGPLAPGADKSLVVISDGKLAIVKDGKIGRAIADHLDDPQGVAVGPDGLLYVSNAGKLQNVSVFAADGTCKRSIGKLGGRPRVGAYDPDGMLEPRGVAVDATGQLWVSEALDSPKRVSVWNSRTGAFVAEYFGGCDYFGYSWIDPRKPDEIYCHNVLWKIDWKKNTCAPVSTIWRATTPNMMQPANPGGYNAHPRFFTAKSGKQFCFGNGRFLSIMFMREGNIYKPFAAFISINRGYVFYGKKTQFPLMSDEKKYPNGCYFWQDANDDQTLQDAELTPIKVLKPKFKKIDFRWFALDFRWVDTDLTAWLRGGHTLKPTRFAKDGRPVYDLMNVEPSFLTANRNGGGEIWLDPQDGGVYTLVHGRVPSLAKWSRDGKMLWGYPNLLTWPRALGLPMSAPGRLWGLTNPLGVAGDFTGNSCYFGTYHIFTRDGIYACMLMRDSRDGKGLGPDVTASETLTGQIVKPDGMNRYFLLAGAADARVTEIFGLDTVKPLPGGTYTLSAAEAKKAAEAQAEYAAKIAKSKRLSIARSRRALDTAEAVSKAIDNHRNFVARAACDEKNLYISYDVTSPYELVNTISDPRMIFKGGNCLDVQIACDPSADPKRKTPAPGDVRLLVTRQKKKPFVVVYRPKVQGFTGEAIVLTSPTGKESFDAIETTDRVVLTYRKTPSGFKAVVTIPLDLIGLHPKPGMTLNMDLGVLYGNATGTAVSARSYWVNNSFSANVTNDVPNESRLEPREWGTAVVE